jgi:hypothetical protein
VIERLIKKGEDGAALAFLNSLLPAIEADGRDSGGGVAPWYYEQMANIYRDHKDYRREVEILERFREQPHAPGAGTPTLLARLDAAKALLDTEGDAFGEGRGVPYQ